MTTRLTFERWHHRAPVTGGRRL